MLTLTLPTPFTSSSHCHLNVYVFTVSNLDSINESKVHYIDWYLRVHALFQCCIDLFFSDCLLCRHGSSYYYICFKQNMIKTFSAKQGFKILLKRRLEYAFLGNDACDKLRWRHVKGRVEDPHSFGRDPFLAYLDYFVY
jgi:hypothetical protein